MSWRNITSGSILTTISQTEYDKYMSTAMPTTYTSSSLVQEIINDVVAEVRGYIIGCKRNSFDVDPTLLPPSCISKAKHIIVYRLMERCGGKIADIDGSRLKNYEAAIAYLEAVSNGDRGIEIPDNPVSPSGQFNEIYGNSYDYPVQY